jgi:hypothetical protein
LAQNGYIYIYNLLQNTKKIIYINDEVLINLNLLDLNNDLINIICEIDEKKGIKRFGEFFIGVLLYYLAVTLTKIRILSNSPNLIFPRLIFALLLLYARRK